MQEQIVVKRQLISYLHWGHNNSHRILLFLHGWRSNKEVWNQIVFRIKDFGFEIYVLDLPGFGGSPAPREAWSIGDYAEIVKGFIEELGLKNVIVVGHSFGGRVAIKLAAMLKTTPTFTSPASPAGEFEAPLLFKEEIIEKLVLVDSAGLAISQKKRMLMRLAAKIAKPFFRPKFTQPLRKKIYQVMGAEDYVTTPELQETFKKIINEDLTIELKRIEIPTLIIWGKNDKETPVSFGEKMHSLIHNSQFIILPDAGHFSFVDKPEEFMKVLNDFVLSSRT